MILTESPLLGVLSGGTGQVSLQLTALTGDPQIDDVFIDPWNRRLTRLARRPGPPRRMLIDSYETPGAENLLLLGRERHSGRDGRARRLLITEAAAAALFIAAAGSFAAVRARHANVLGLGRSR